jgi:acetyl esterase
VLVWFHGGGFALGSVAESDADCRHLADKSRCAVLSVDYRLAPEFKYPTALHDCAASLRWLYAHTAELGLDSDRVAIGGDSAGGALATSTCLFARDHGERVPNFQLLIYPITDISSFSTTSYQQNAEGFYLTRQAMQWFAEQYAAEPERTGGYVSPLQAESLSGLPPTFIATAEYDPLRDEGALYAKRLSDAGVQVQLKQYDGMIHGFFSMHDYLETGRRALQEASAALRSALVG